ncbi:ATP-binding protein [Planctomycetota bacterium]
MPKREKPASPKIKSPQDAGAPAQDWFRALADQAGYGVAMADFQGRLQYANPAFCRILDYPAETALNTDLKRLLQIGDHQPSLWQTDQLCTTRNLMHPRRDGHVISIQIVCTQAKDTLGRFSFMGLTVTDNSVRYELEQRLHMSEQTYRTLVESAGEAIVVVDRQGLFHFMNGVAAERLGGQPEVFIGQTMGDLFPPPIAKKQLEVVRQVIKTGAGQNIVSQTQVSGQLKWYNTTVVPLRETLDTPSAKALIIGRDIDQLKRAQEELAGYRDDMMRAEQLAALGTLSAMIAHELNQPLTVFGLSLGNALFHLDEDRVDVAELKEMLGDAQAEIGNMSAIINRFRSFARRSSKKTIGPVDVGEVAQCVVDLLQHSAQQAQVYMQLHIEPKLAPLIGDAKALMQVFFTLIQNALQAAVGEHPHQIEIRIASNQDKHILQIDVMDDCGGIAPEHRNRLFEPFFSTKPDGTGLGLFLVQRIIAEMGGDINVASTVDEGSCFTMRLPLQ